MRPLVSPKSAIEDVNKDGRPDLVLHFDIPAVAAAIGCPRAVNALVAVQVIATSTNGISVVGSDFVRITNE